MTKNKSEDKQLEIKRKKEYIRFIDSQLYKLRSNQKFLSKKLDKLLKKSKIMRRRKVRLRNG